MKIDKEKAITELIEQIKQVEISIFYTLLNYSQNSEIAYMLSTDDFYSNYAKRYIQAIQSLLIENAEVTAITVYDKLRENGIAEDSDFAKLIELQTATATVVAGTRTVEILKKYVRQLKAYKKLQELQQKVLENIENSDDIDIESLKDEYFEFESEQEKKYITNDEILQCIENKDFSQKWIFENFVLTKSIHILDGRGGAKKSRFVLQLAVCAVAQQDFLCFSFKNKEIGIEFKNVFFISPKTENNHYLLAFLIERLCNQMNLDYNEILKHLIFIQSPQSLLKEERRGIEPTKFYFEIKSLCKQYKPDLIIIDPLMRIAGVELTNQNVATLYNHLEQLDTAIVLVHHQPKSDTGKDIASTTALGGVMLRELARARFILRENELMIEKNNMSKYFNHVVKLSYDYNYCIFSTTQKEPFEKEFVKTLEQYKVNGRNGKKY
ncbi:AAA family ATPase [Thermodesulfovibrio yellowstonii]|uniref:AAA family ATPase n=1 Tax=Thermodesulfovibrio yellowstonii TaxID=28262 RepID=UPI0024B37367|nr:AAA family ATPase [Thermodesulfovibrio yellowstonii]MDI6864643.1 AAA family ATPase [Thermodesulfovibrio yellowstonii]